MLIVIVAVCALASAAIDPDEVLRSMRRVSFRSALTATIATRMVPLLALDAQRHRRGAALPPDAGRAPRRDARDHRQRARPLTRHRRDARGPRLRHRATPARAAGARSRATTSRFAVSAP